MEFTSIFVGVISMAVTDDQLQVMLGAKAKKIRRYHEKAKFGHASILIPNRDVDRVLKLDLSVAGHKLRVATWRSEAPHRVPAYVTNRHRNGRQPAIVATAVIKEQALFVAEFLDAQAGPAGRRSVYSQVASNTAEVRMKSMETAIYGVKQLLERLTQRRKQ